MTKPQRASAYMSRLKAQERRVMMTRHNFRNARSETGIKRREAEINYAELVHRELEQLALGKKMKVKTSNLPFLVLQYK